MKNPILLTLTIALLIGFALIACDDGNNDTPTHTHTWGA